jgi:hypothetical protein
MTPFEGVVCLPIPQVSEQRTVRVWCPALQQLVEVKGQVKQGLGLEVCVWNAASTKCWVARASRTGRNAGCAWLERS